RKAQTELTLSDGRKVAANLQRRGNVWRVLFPDPDSKGRYREVSTGKSSQPDAWVEAAKIVADAYDPSAKPNARTVTWEQALAKLPTAADFRPRALEVYVSGVNILRNTLLAATPPVSTTGPHDITPVVAKRFRSVYAAMPFKRGVKGKEYPRSPKTVENALRRMSALWEHLRGVGLASSNPWVDVPWPTVPKVPPKAPTEADIDQFFAWVDGKGWELLSVFLRVKSLMCCRTRDLCSVKASQFDPRANTVSIDYTVDKTHRTRTVPLPADLAGRLDAVKGRVLLWDRYAEESKAHRPGRSNKATFTPSMLYWYIADLFPEYRAAFPDRFPITPHDLRRRGITLMVAATGSIDKTAEAIGIHPDTARRHYLDAQKAFASDELFKKMASVLVPK
ncbi:MAG: site-specific integrase, partial [Gemmataceae bacterium]|nr:site-specific integrase [Gemmataceae bacterium]